MIGSGKRVASSQARPAGPPAVPTRPSGRVILSRALTVGGMFCLAAWFPGSVQVGALLIILATVDLLRRPVRFPWGIPVFIGWALLSASWSLLPVETLDDVVKLMAVATAAVFLANSIGPSRFAADLALALGLVCLASLGAAVVAPEVALDFQSALRGITPHANSLGFEAALLVLSSLLMVAGAGRRRSGWIALSVTGAVTLLLTTSVTAMLGLAAGLGACGVVWFVRWGSRENRPLRVWGVVGAAGAIGLLGASSFESLTFLLGRDPTFTGRTQIWTLVADLIGRRPVTGYGVGAPWREGSPIRPFVQQSLGFEFVTAHNGLLDLALEAGVVGLVILVPMAVVTLVRYLVAPRLDRGLVWATGICVFFATVNVAEAYITHPFSWLILCYLWTIPLSLPLEPRAVDPDAASDPAAHQPPKESS